MHPQIEFKHVLSELSVNRNDPCEVLRELISNSYDAGAKNIYYAPFKDRKGFAFLDDGVGLDTEEEVRGITPWAAFFSIGKSTKAKGDAIGYKCQGSKLCFASSRILVATKNATHPSEWQFKLLDNPRSNLDTSLDITPTKTKDIIGIVDKFFPTPSSDTTASLKYLKTRIAALEESATLVVIDHLDTEDYGKYFAVGSKPQDSYVYNYIRFYTRHGDVRCITTAQGFSASQRTQVSVGIAGVSFECFNGKKEEIVPFGFPYLEIGKADPSIKTPAQISRLRDGRFFARYAKCFTVGTERFSVIFTVDGNRRAHDEYQTLGRRGKGQARSGVKLSEHRGVFISVKGIKVCKYPDLLLNLDGYEVLAEGDSPSHYSMIIDGNFDLVTNRNALTKSALDTLTQQEFLAEVKKFLDSFKKASPTFSELVTRLKRESSETLLNEQIEMLEAARSEVKKRERFRIKDSSGQEHIFLCPNPGEEYLVGVLYSQLATMLPKNPGFEKYWRKVITFSTQGIDSLGLKSEIVSSPLSASNVCSIEYKYDFNNSGPFNHALAVVDYIIAWTVTAVAPQRVEDTFTCFGKISKTPDNDFEWEISEIESQDADKYAQKITVIDLRKLILKSFDTTFVTP